MIHLIIYHSIHNIIVILITTIQYYQSNFNLISKFENSCRRDLQPGVVLARAWSPDSCRWLGWERERRYSMTRGAGDG